MNPFTLTVTRTFAPVTKTFTSCRQCPYYKPEQDGNATLPTCQHPQFNGGDNDGYRSVLKDINTWKSDIISIDCPFRINPPK